MKIIKQGLPAHQDDKKVPLVRNDNPENIIGHCILHDIEDGVMFDIHVNGEKVMIKDGEQNGKK